MMTRRVVFRVEEQKLQLVASTKTARRVVCLNAFNGKLLAGMGNTLQLYRLVTSLDGTRELQVECEHTDPHRLINHIQSFGDSVVACFNGTVLLFVYEEEGGARKRRALAQGTYVQQEGGALKRLNDDDHLNVYMTLDSDLLILANNRILFGTDSDIYIVNTDPENEQIVQGKYPIADTVRRFLHGSLTRSAGVSDQIYPTVVFGTEGGMIGIIASLPDEDYSLMQQLEVILREERPGFLGHEEWRSSAQDLAHDSKTVYFLDGDVIESFLLLGTDMMEKIAEKMNQSVDTLVMKVELLSKLH